MPEPFKNFFNPKMIAQMGEHLAGADASFDKKTFVKLACDGLELLELRQRSDRIRDALIATLPEDFRKACQTMTGSLHPVDDSELGDMSMDDKGIRGWPIMPMGDVVAHRGLEDFDFAMDVLAEMTKRFSAEFAVRAFFNYDPPAAMAKAMNWANDDNFHIRRLASEGSRPRLPWGTQIPQFIEDPGPLMPLLDKLKDDPEEYVRRSVANNINDIAKDHPDLVARIAKDWAKKGDTNRTRLIRHACRTLIKNGHQPTLAALGYGKPKLELTALTLSNDKVKVGQTLEFNIELRSKASAKQPLIIDYAIHYLMANGKQSAKVYKWKQMDLKAGKTISVAKKHNIKPITTRVFYPGTHALEIQINGQKFAKREFELHL